MPLVMGLVNSCKSATVERIFFQGKKKKERKGFNCELLCAVSQRSVWIFEFHRVSQLSVGLSSLHSQLKPSTLTLAPPK